MSRHSKPASPEPALKFEPALKLPNCPICKNPAVVAHKPFCSATCRNRDMHKWFTNAYALPADTGEEEDEGLRSPGSEDDA